jgi:hypothetical protein
MAYRATASTNTGLSPFEVVFGKTMPTTLDWSLLPVEPTAPSAQQYSREMGPKLKIFHQIAMENVADSAFRHGEGHNSEAKIPEYKTGDKVLLHDTVVKKGESGKLKLRYAGPFIITDCKLGWGWKQGLQVTTGHGCRSVVGGVIIT